MSQRIWVNFKELRAKLRFEEVLRHYKVEIRAKGSQHQGPCPLPNHTVRPNAPTFSANLDRGIFQCFGCRAKGNVLEFAALMERVNPADGDALRAIAIELQTRFFPNEKDPQANLALDDKPPAESRNMPVQVNVPMDFELKGLEHGHESLVRRGFTMETMSYFGVGFCSRGMLKDKIAIPLHDAEGRQVGYAGWSVDDSSRYLFPSRRERNGIVYEFDSSLLVYNAHRVKAPCNDLIVVQGFPSVWWLNQCGFPHSLALIGEGCSEVQAETVTNLLKPSGRLWLLTDGTDEGDKLALIAAGRFARRRFLRWARLDPDVLSTNLSAAELEACFNV